MTSDWSRKSLLELESTGVLELGRGKVISKKDLANCPGSYPVYSSAKQNEGRFGEYGKYMFDEELITWSVDGGGRLFHRPKHKFSVTNVGGTLRILQPEVLDYRFLFYYLTLLHSTVNFDWVKKAHPSVIRKIYNDIPVPPLLEQKRITAILDETFAGIEQAIRKTEENIANVDDLYQSCLSSVLDDQSETWVTMTLLDAVEADCALSYGIVQPGNQIDDGLALVRPTDLKQKVIGPNGLKRIDPAMADAYKRTMLRGKEILLCVRGSTGVVAVASEELSGANVTRGIVPIRFDPTVVNQEFGYYVLSSKSVQDQIKTGTYGMALKQINIRDVKKIELAAPALDVQSRLLSRLDAISAGTERLRSIYLQKRNSFQTLKQSVLEHAFSDKQFDENVTTSNEAVA